ncbi:hypothetical protein TNCV_1903401 [Trichonephila clavipes]|nr:hypothetical protein TNCV_1903401 [Trichonephila clavipes]
MGVPKIAVEPQVLSRSFEHHTEDRTNWLDSTRMLRKKTLEVFRGLPLQFRFPQPHERSIEYPSTNIHLIIHLQTSMSSPGFEPRFYGTTVSVTNHYGMGSRFWETFNVWIEALSTAHIEQKNDLEIFAFPVLDRKHLESRENVGDGKYKQNLFTICGTRFSGSKIFHYSFPARRKRLRIIKFHSK